jgi:hypothetical protein
MTHPFADGCPDCGPVMDSPPVAPHTVQDLDGSNVRALYRCPACSRAWFTGWNADAVIGRRESEGGAA